jgi:hypothetical protein
MRRALLFLLFFPASFGIMRQIFVPEDLSSLIIALGTFCICVDQARMAEVDLRQIAQFQEKIADDRLKRFFAVTITTIILELLGFYLAAFWLGWGVWLVLVSQIWFHCLAAIQLQPTTNQIIAHSISQRLPVLLTDGIGIILVFFWSAKIAPLAMAVTLTTMVLIYGWVKYVIGSREREMGKLKADS